MNLLVLLELYGRMMKRISYDSLFVDIIYFCYEYAGGASAIGVAQSVRRLQENGATVVFPGAAGEPYGGVELLHA